MLSIEQAKNNVIYNNRNYSNHTLFFIQKFKTFLNFKSKLEYKINIFNILRNNLIIIIVLSSYSCDYRCFIYVIIMILTKYLFEVPVLSIQR